MHFLLNGYFGFGNAGDEAVLAAMIDDLRRASPGAQFCATSGNPLATSQTFGIKAIGRQAPRELLAAIRHCDVFLSGGGSLVQDVTSLRNVVYYTTLLRWARWSGKKTMVYAQGVGPLHKTISQKLARAAFESTDILTVRDPESAALLQKIGVKKRADVTADPVWGLLPRGESPREKKWLVALRSWPSRDEGTIARLVAAIRVQAQMRGAVLQFLPMQPDHDTEILRGLASNREILETRGKHPGEILSLAKSCELMLAMRLHALIFALAGGVPVVAFSYDPKVASLAKIAGAPCVTDPSEVNLTRLGTFIEAARAPDAALLAALREKAFRTAELAASLAK